MRASNERRHASGRPPALLRTDLPTTEALLVSGGDARIALGADNVSNRYGCRALPDEALIALGSSTASVVSKAGFAAADRLRKRLLLAAQTETWSAIYALELRRIRHELKQACGISELLGIEIVFAASGTDLHLVAAQLTGGVDASASLAITVDASETGSCVPAALSGRHFSTRAAFSERVHEGAFLPSDRGIEVATVALRSSDTKPRLPAEVNAEVEALVVRAAAADRRTLLVIVDVSKTGLVAPSFACVADLQRRFPDTLDVLVDACQFRIAPETLRAYLERGCMVALTGSKFVTGPAFSGALLIPPSTARRLRARPLPSGLRDYCSRADWPEEWAAGQGLEPVDNFGLLLRWEAALHELSAFRAIPARQITRFLTTFADAIRTRVLADPTFELLDVPAIDRSGLVAGEHWDRVQTIFPFLLRSTAGGAFLNREQTALVHRRLLEGDRDPAAIRCQLGQPVPCGTRGGVQVSALRLCASARLVVDATRAGGQQRVIDNALAALDRTAQLAQSCV